MERKKLRPSHCIRAVKWSVISSVARDSLHCAVFLLSCGTAWRIKTMMILTTSSLSASDIIASSVTQQNYGKTGSPRIWVVWAKGAIFCLFDFCQVLRKCGGNTLYVQVRIGKNVRPHACSVRILKNMSEAMVMSTR